MIERKAALFACYRDGSMLLDGRDGLKPPRFYLTPQDNFPWGEFLGKLLFAWQLCENEDVPPQFQPRKRIPQFVLDGFGKEPIESKLKILATLRVQGYFAALPNRR